MTNGCVSTAAQSVTYTVLTTPIITVTSSDADNNICIDELVVFTTTGAGTYIYTVAGLQTANNATGLFQSNDILNTDVVSVTGYNGDCPSIPQTFTFVVNSINLAMTVSPSTLVCAGTAVTFTSSGADEYQYMINNTNQGASSPTTTFTTSTLNDLDSVFVVGYSLLTGCFQTLDYALVMSVKPLPVITADGPLAFCDGDSVTLTSNYSYGNQWLLNGVAIAGATGTSYVALVAGNYTLQNTAGGSSELWSIGYNANGMFGDNTTIL